MQVQVLFDFLEVKSEEISVNLTFGGRKGLKSSRGTRLELLEEALQISRQDKGRKCVSGLF